MMSYAEFLIIFSWKTVDELKIPNISNHKFNSSNDPLKRSTDILKITLVLQT